MFIVQKILYYFVFFAEAVRRNVETQNATERDIEKALMNWLRGSGDRNGGRKRPAKVRAPPVPAANAPSVIRTADSELATADSNSD